jgi:hypothetical protein
MFLTKQLRSRANKSPLNDLERSPSQGCAGISPPAGEFSLIDFGICRAAIFCA